MKKGKNITILDEHFEKRYGKRGTSSRAAFETKAITFLKKEIIKEQRQTAKLNP